MDDSYNIVILIIIYIIGAMINRAAKGKHDKGMQELAARLSLEYVEGGMMRKPRLAGIYENREVMIENLSRSKRRGDKDPVFRVVMFVDIPLPDSIRVYNARSFGPVTDLFSEIGEFFGVHDIPFDNSVFDEKFVVRGRNEAIVRSVLDPAVQESLISISKANLVIQGTEIIYEDEGNAAENESRIRTIFQIQDLIAKRIADVAAVGGFEVEEETPRDVFKPKPAQKPMEIPSDIGLESGQAGEVVMRALEPDLVAARSDYYPQPISPDDVIIQLRREGYYTGD